jgi:arabinogalactan oligomer/maltooligosaccharide transport system substrate-binding protein
MAVSALGLVGCRQAVPGAEDPTEISGDASAVTVNVWCPSTDNDITNKLIASFKEANPTYANATIKIMANVGEGDIKTALLKDPKAGADVMCVADDNIRDCVDGEALLPLSDNITKRLVSEVGQSNVDGASIDGICYGYPYRADNGPMMYYDSAKVTSIGKIEDILQQCKDKGLKFFFDLNNAWYDCTALWAAGGTNSVNEKQQIVVNFGTEAVAKGAEAWRQLYVKYVGTWISSSDLVAWTTAVTDGTFGAGMFWNNIDKFQAVNANVKVSAYPTINIDGKDKQMKSFIGTKDICLNAKTLTGDKLVIARAFARYYSGIDAQNARVGLGYGPAATSLADSDAVKALPFAGACVAQSKLGAVPQAATVTGKFWDPVAAWSSLITLNAATDNWGTYGTGVDGALAALKAKIVNADGFVAAE